MLRITAILSLLPMAALGHHGLMLWQEDVVTRVDGFISEEMDGFPHWELSVRTADGQDWQVDLGSDFEMDRAGMKPEDLKIGADVTVEGSRPRDSDALLLRPRRIIVGGSVFEFRGDWN